MTRLASLRFERVLDERERADATRALASSGTTVRTWKSTRAQTFATVSLGGEASPEDLARALCDAVVAFPPEFALRVRPDAARRLPRLLDAFAGAGAPAGVSAARLDGDALVLVCDPARSSPALVLALVAAELALAPGRTIEPLVELSDASLASLAGALLGEPRLDASRVLDAYVDAVAARC